ncbi:hypothetical protein C3L33_17397, partial [Rhododendron williamsianum]
MLKVYTLRQRFVHSTDPGGLAGDRRDTILGSRFSVIAEEIWNIIKEHKDLDIPSLMVMLATLRCGEIAETKRAAFDANEGQRTTTESRNQKSQQLGVSPETDKGHRRVGDGWAMVGDGRWLLDEDRQSLDKGFERFRYDMETAYFDKAVRSEKRKHLEETLMQLFNNAYSPAFQFVQSTFPSIFANIGSRTLKEFKGALKNAIQTGQEVEVASRDCTEACLKSFDDKIAGGVEGNEVNSKIYVIVEEANCNPSKVREKLQDEMNDHIEKVRADEKFKVILSTHSL